MCIFVLIILFIVIPICALLPQVFIEYKTRKYGTEHTVIIEEAVEGLLLRQIIFTINDVKMMLKVLPGVCVDPKVGDSIHVIVWKNNAIVGA